MTTDPDAPEITPEEAAAAFGLPIEHLFTIDPLDITADDLLLLIAHYRGTRLQYNKLAEKPKAVEKSRGPKLTPEETKAEAQKVLDQMMDKWGL